MAQVYRVTVKHPGPWYERRVKYGNKRMLAQTWAFHLREHEECRRRGIDTSDAVFGVEVAPSAVFKDISAIYDVEGELLVRSVTTVTT